MPGLLGLGRCRYDPRSPSVPAIGPSMIGREAGAHYRHFISVFFQNGIMTEQGVGRYPYLHRQTMRFYFFMLRVCFIFLFLFFFIRLLSEGTLRLAWRSSGRWVSRGRVSFELSAFCITARLFGLYRLPLFPFCLAFLHVCVPCHSCHRKHGFEC